MMKHYILLATLLFTQVLSAAESKLIDDAPKGFIHIQDGPSDLYLRADTVVQLEQSLDDKEGTHYVRLYAASSVILKFKTKDEATECMKKLLNLLSVKN
jgi:hypothetical protein